MESVMRHLMMFVLLITLLTGCAPWIGMHKIDRRPVAVGDSIEIRPMMYVALSYDHRIIDGREAVTFLVRVKECIEDPERILLAV